jgi:hypothetical protein
MDRKYKVTVEFEVTFPHDVLVEDIDRLHDEVQNAVKGFTENALAHDVCVDISEILKLRSSVQSLT